MSKDKGEATNVVVEVLEAGMPRATAWRDALAALPGVTVADDTVGQRPDVMVIAGDSRDVGDWADEALDGGCAVAFDVLPVGADAADVARLLEVARREDGHGHVALVSPDAQILGALAKGLDLELVREIDVDVVLATAAGQYAVGEAQVPLALALSLAFPLVAEDRRAELTDIVMTKSWRSKLAARWSGAIELRFGERTPTIVNLTGSIVPAGLNNRVDVRVGRGVGDNLVASWTTVDGATGVVSDGWNEIGVPRTYAAGTMAAARRVVTMADASREARVADAKQLAALLRVWREIETPGVSPLIYE